MGQEDIEAEPEKKKPRVRVGIDAAEAFEMIASAIKDQQADRSAMRYNKVEQAIHLLEEQYQQRLSATDFIEAVEVLENNSKASVFITLKSSELRDRWLEKNASIYFCLLEGEELV